MTDSFTAIYSLLLGQWSFLPFLSWLLFEKKKLGVVTLNGQQLVLVNLITVSMNMFEHNDKQEYSASLAPIAIH